MSEPDTLFTRRGGWRGVSRQGGVSAFSVVVLEPGSKRGAPLFVARPCPRVGPLGLQRPVESFGFAVGPGVPGFGEPTLDLQRGADRSPVGAVPVGHGVVGENS